MNKRGFASDNFSGILPEVMEAIQNANQGHAMAYGGDSYTAAAIEKFKTLFGNNIDVYFAFNGTGANVISLSTLTQSYHSIICPATAHIQVDECGAPDKFTGCKVIPIACSDGKITPELILPHLHGFGFEHHSQPKMISITQCTELGTVYTPQEVKAICDLAHANNMYVHMDGARLANAVVSLDVDVKEFTTLAGVDVLSFGGTKNGMMLGEAVIFFNPELSKEAKYIRKQSMQLCSKMRYIGAQFDAMLTNGLWLKTARHANKMAKLLEQEVRKIDQIQITQKVQANGIWALVPKDKIEQLQKEYFFWVWDEHAGEVRWLCSFDTTEEDILGFVKLLKQTL
ncbi:low specificity L-threonine aldolase [Labilibaculum sp. K2S]|uniref:threonine aldolase family protein n=1 Tax=Labilibaculum sp. K2S TaxID=3056386 RepID=UPI0025A40CFD|nr:low specificity L-threonine aldolase [Labilibaculum sp. K2S]MDM8160688.1 low specificity L-threonine aldolase [Labilibaculum sp. K2S]